MENTEYCKMAQELVVSAQEEIEKIKNEVELKYGLIIKKEALDNFVDYFNGNNGLLKYDNFQNDEDIIKTMERLTHTEEQSNSEKEECVKLLIDIIVDMSYNKPVGVIISLRKKLAELKKECK